MHEKVISAIRKTFHSLCSIWLHFFLHFRLYDMSQWVGGGVCVGVCGGGLFNDYGFHPDYPHYANEHHNE